MTLMVLSRSGGRVLAGLALASILSACNSDHSLMPTPAIYVGAGAKPMFESASANHSANNIDLLYVTDRAPIIAPDGSLSYGVDRSRHMSFGSLTVDIDGAPSDPPTGPQLRLSSINRIGSFPVFANYGFRAVDEFRSNRLALWRRYSRRSLRCSEQFRIMTFAQMTYRESLRDIEACLAHNHRSCMAWDCVSSLQGRRWPMQTNGEIGAYGRTLPLS